MLKTDPAGGDLCGRRFRCFYPEPQAPARLGHSPTDPTPEGRQTCEQHQHHRPGKHGPGPGHPRARWRQRRRDRSRHPDGISGAQQIAKAAPADAHVVKAFNTMFANVVAAGRAGDRPLDVFIAGDDAAAKALVSSFIESLALRPLDTGPLAMARYLEATGLLLVGLVRYTVKHNRFSLGINISS
jgi:hypothetical protein